MNVKTNQNSMIRIAVRTSTRSYSYYVCYSPWTTDISLLRFLVIFSLIRNKTDEAG